MTSFWQVRRRQDGWPCQRSAIQGLTGEEKMATQRRKKAEEALLMALAHGATPRQAAEKVGVHKRTVHRRLADPEFQRKLKAQQAEMVQSTAGLMTAASGGSVRTLVLLQVPPCPLTPAAVLPATSSTWLYPGVRLRIGKNAWLPSKPE